jgi:hypothetical protein
LARDAIALDTVVVVAVLVPGKTEAEVVFDVVALPTLLMK